MTNIVFNIVYTPGTVAQLAFMVRSLLHWSDCSFRLVSNGCLPPEQRYLRSLCVGNSRLEYYALPTQEPWEHGLALDFLHVLSPGEHFGFLDSDIFACGEFMPAVLAARSRSAAVFSGAPIWSTTANHVFRNNFITLAGIYHIVEPDAEVGCTYFALYDAAALDALFQKHSPLSFLHRSWDTTSEACRSAVRRVHRSAMGFDTAKLMNLMLIANGARLEYVDLPHLIHIGGTSFLRADNLRRNWWSQLPSSARIHEFLWARKFTQMHFPDGKATREEVNEKTEVWLRQRDIVRTYFWRLLHALSSRTPLPELPSIDNAEIRTRTHTASAELIAAHRQFAD